jgi:hypothetical protein
VLDDPLPFDIDRWPACSGGGRVVFVFFGYADRGAPLIRAAYVVGPVGSRPQAPSQDHHEVDAGSVTSPYGSS